jgi:hypothetical protein
MAVIRAQFDFPKFKSKVSSIVDKTAKNGLRDTSYINNEDISPSHDYIDDQTEFALNRAENNGVLDSIQRHPDPLGFCVEGGNNLNWVKFYGWNLSELKLLSIGENVSEARNYNEFGVYGRYKYDTPVHKSDVKGTYNDVWSEIKDLDRG